MTELVAFTFHIGRMSETVIAIEQS